MTGARQATPWRRARIATFSVLVIACVAGAAATALIAIRHARADAHASRVALQADHIRAEAILHAGKPFAVFRNLDRAHPGTYGRMAVAAVDGDKVGAPVLAGPACQRVAFSGGRGLCLDLLGTAMQVELLDSDLRTVHSVTLPGIPSRARLSPDGRWGGVTAFLVGHAYAAPGTFSTAATIIDMRTGHVVGDLEKDFTVTNGGKVVDERDRNYWGLTFASDDDTFYATLATGGRTWLIKGSISRRRAVTIHENVECPSLSPDGTRIGYKKAVSHDPTVWRFTVLDLATGKETPLAESRSVDDQLAWLDNRHVLYADNEQTWMANADGSGRARVWSPRSDSTTVVEDEHVRS